MITHAHGDHARAGQRRLSVRGPVRTAAPTPVRPRRRDRDAFPTASSCRSATSRLSFHPGRTHPRLRAGAHRSGDGVWVVSGDYKRAADPTCAPFEPLPCDTFVTESTFGLPIYRWDPTDAVIADIVGWWDATATRDARRCCSATRSARRSACSPSWRASPIGRCYVHGMMLAMIDVYREPGVAMLPVTPVIERRAAPRGTSFAGELVLAPLSARGTPWMRRFGDFSDAFASGLMRVRGVRRQRAYDRGFVLSDHADWPALLADDRRDRRHAASSPRTAMPSRSPAICASTGLESGVIRTAWEGEPTGE